MAPTWERDGFVVDTDRERLDIQTIHGFLSESYWSPGIPREAVERAIAHSLCFGIYEVDGHNDTARPERQVGFGRLVTDMTSFAYLADVFVLPAYRGRGLARWMTSCALAHPELQTVRRWLLSTADAHGVYAAVGFEPLPEPGRYMTIKRVPPWQRESGASTNASGG